MRMNVCVKISVFVCFHFVVHIANAQHYTPDSQEKDSITLFFVGDVMQHYPQIEGAKDPAGNYGYTTCFQYVRPYLTKSDYVFANLETTLSDRNFSGYPRFCAPWQLARDLQFCGVDLLTTNNNHCCDKGAKGIKETIHFLDSLHILHTGTFTDTTTWLRETPLYIRNGKFKLAVLSYTYGTNGIPVTGGQVVSIIDTLIMKRQITKARLDSATNIIVFLHWGEEYANRQNEEQETLAAFLHEQGADIVIGSHPHVVQPLEYTLEGQDTCGITVYSLGNFISNQRKRYTNGGICVELHLVQNNGKTHYRMSYLSCYVFRNHENERLRYYIVPEPDAPALLGSRDSLLYTRFFQDTDDILQGRAAKYSDD